MASSRVLLIVSVLILSQIAVAPTVMAGSGDPTDLPDSQIIEASDVVNVWDESALNYRVQTDNAALRVQNPSVNVRAGSLESSLGKDFTAAFNPGTELTFEYDTGNSNLHGENVQVVAARAEPVDGSAPNTFSDALDALTSDNANENASYYFVDSGTSLNPDSGDATTTTEFTFEPPKAGHYAFFIAVTQDNNQISIDGNQNISISDDITVIGGDAATVQRGSATVDRTTSNPEPGDTVNFDVDASDQLAESGVTHGIAVYDQDTLRDSAHLIDIDRDNLDKNFNITDDSEFFHSLEKVDGTATIEDGASINGIEFSDGTVSRAVGSGAIIDFIGEELNGNVPATSFDSSLSTSSTTVLNASMDVDVDEDGDHTLTIETNDEWETGTYEYVYMSAMEDDKSSVSSQTGTFQIDNDDGGDDDNNDDDDGSSSGGGGGGIGGADDEQEEQQDGEEEQQDGEEQSPTVEEVREELEQTEPNTESQSEIVDNDPDRPGVNINPEETESVREVTINNEQASGNLDIREWQDPPETVSQSVSGALQDDQELAEEVAEEVEVEAEDDSESGDDADGSDDGDSSDGSDTQVASVEAQVVTVADISPDSDEARESDGTVTMTADRDRLDDPQDAVIVHESGDSWETLETTVEETSEGEVTLEANTDSFSLFAVAEVEQVETEPGTTDGGADEGGADDGGTDDGPGSTALIGLLVLVVLAVIAAVSYRQMNQ